MNTTLVYEYKGYQYRIYLDLDIEEDNELTFHYCYNKEGAEVKKLSNAFYNHSPYSDVPYESFVSMIDELTS
jgi:hypothetical protein